MLGCESRWLSRLALASVAWAGLITSPLPAQQPPAGTLAEQPDDALPAAYPLPADRLGAAADEVRRRYPASLVRVSIDARNSQLLVVAPSVVQQDIRKFLTSGGPAAPQAPTGATAPMPNAAANPYLAGLNAPPASETPVPTPADPRPTAPQIPDSLPGDPTAGVPLANRLHTLAQLPPRDLEETLRRAWPSQLTFTPSADGQQVSVELNGNRRVLQIDRRAKTVRFEGPDEAVRLWRSLVETLDRPRRSTDEQIAITSLDKAEPETIRSALMMLRQAALRGGTLIEPAANGNRRFTGLASLIFQPAPESAVPNPPAPNPQAPNPPAQPNPATNQPNPADADPEAADDPTDLEEGGSIGDVQLEFIPEFGVVVVKGNKRDVARVMRIIDQITQQSVETQPEVEVVLLQHINANAVATLVTDLYTQAFATRQTPVSIVSLDKPNALVLVGRPEAIASVKTILEKLDQPVPASTQLKIFRLEHMSAIDAEQTVRNFFVTNPGQGGNTPENLRPALGTKVRVIADYRTNSLIVQASSRDLEEVAFLLARLDIESTDATHVLRVFKLRNALAVDLATVLQQAISGVALSAAGAPQTTTAASTGPSQPVTTQKSTNLSIIGIDKAGNRLVQAGILNDVTVAADANINALVVRGPARAMDLMGSLIEQLDQMPDATSQIKVFELENGDATAMTAMLQQLFGQQVTAGQGVLNQFVQSQALSNLTGGAGAGDSSLIPLRFAIDQRTNAIIASGSAGDLQVVELLILRLDESGVEPRITNVVRLKNAPALDVATAISNFLVSQRAITQQQAQFTGTFSLLEQIDQEVIVVPELVTNSLIISASPRFYDNIMKIVNDLDFRPAMVMVQVLIAEVSLSDDFEFGVELGLQDSLLFNRNLAPVAPLVAPGTPGFNFNGVNTPNNNNFAQELLAGRAVSNFAMGTASGTTGYGGLVLSAASESVNILVRALQDAGRLQILSRPQVMTLDNEPAFVQVGQRVARITGSSTNAQAGGTSNSTVDVDVGLLLRIQPRVNTDGVVVMTLDAERSTVGDPADGTPVAVTPGGQAVNSPPINTTTAQTTVSAKSGQTIVFAGLIQKSKTIASRRVPYVSDIPVLGRLFRFDAESEMRSELLIILTPHIIDDDQDIEWMNYTESDRMSWCFADVVEMHGYAESLSGGHGLWGPPSAPTIYPDLTPTADLLPGTVLEAEPIDVPGPVLSTPPGPTPAPPTESPVPPPAGPVPPPPPASSRRPEPTLAPARQATYYSAGPDQAAPAQYQTSQPQRLPMPTGR